VGQIAGDRGVKQRFAGGDGLGDLKGEFGQVGQVGRATDRGRSGADLGWVGAQCDVDAVQIGQVYTRDARHGTVASRGGG
jgi:hypothetical protein